MKKNTVIRHDAPHSVKVQEGSNVAQRKFKKPPLSAEPEVPAEVKKAVKSAPTVIPSKAKPSAKPPAKPPAKSPAKPPAKSPAKTRAKANLKTPPAISSAAAIPAAAVVAAPPEAVISIGEKTPIALAPVVLSEADLWEKESPINHRLSELRTRNALLNEQLQRLKTPFQARGKKS